MGSLIHKTWDILLENADTAPLHSNKIIFGNRRAKNFKDILTKARISYHESDSDNSLTLPLSQTDNRCTRRNCRYCPLINTTSPVVNLYNGRTYDVLNNITCRSNNLVYVITCKVCGKQYVGETYRCLYERFQGHLGDVDRNIPGKVVAIHYNEPDHHGWSDMEISGLYYCPLSRGSPNNIGVGAQLDRWRMEWHWMCQLNTLYPVGLNVQEDRRRGGFAIP